MAKIENNEIIETEVKDEYVLNLSIHNGQVNFIFSGYSTEDGWGIIPGEKVWGNFPIVTGEDIPGYIRSAGQVIGCSSGAYWEVRPCGANSVDIKGIVLDIYKRAKADGNVSFGWYGPKGVLPR